MPIESKKPILVDGKTLENPGFTEQEYQARVAAEDERTGTTLQQRIAQTNDTWRNAHPEGQGINPKDIQNAIARNLQGRFEW